MQPHADDIASTLQWLFQALYLEAATGGVL